MHFLRQLLCAAAALHLLAAPAAAQTYPAKPIRLIVPFAPGGASDFLARIMVPKLSTELGQTIVIENKPGAAGNIGMEAAATAAPDGYIAFLGNVGTLAVNPAIFGPKIKAMAAELTPVSLVATAPDVLVVGNAVPARSVAEFVDHARKNPGLSFASPGSGSLNRLEMELFRAEARLDMVHVPYKGGAGPALVDVVGGHVPAMFVPVPAAMQLIKGNRLRPLGVASKSRIAGLPEVPTLAESGYPNVVGGSWQAVMFPAKTPEAIVAKWHGALAKVLAREDLRRELQQGGVEVTVSASPKELAEFISEQERRWAAVVKASNATAD